MLKLADLQKSYKLRILFKTGPVFGLFFIVCFTQIDPDFGWHLQAGNYFLAHGIPSHDIFTYTARNFPWIDHAWGTDIIISWLYHLQGYLLLSLFFAGIWTAGLMLYAARARLLILLLAAAALVPFVAIRPNAWDVLGLALVLRLLNAKDFSKKRWLLLPLFLLWANLHGGFVMGLAIILYFVVIQRRRELVVWLAACILVTFVNPYGPRLYTEVFRTLTDVSLHSQTLGMKTFALPYVDWTLAGIWIIGFLAYQRKQLKSWVGLTPIFLVASLAAVRMTVFFSILAAPELDRFWDKTAKFVPVWSKPAKYLLYVVSMVLISAAYLVYLGVQLPPRREDPYPVKAVSYIKQHNCNGNLFNDFNIGGYLIWKLPQYSVYIDGRMPSWKDQNGQKYLSTYLNLESHPTLAEKTLQHYKVGCALLGKEDWQKVTKLLVHDGWLVKSDSDNWVLLYAPVASTGQRQL